MSSPSFRGPIHQGCQQDVLQPIRRWLVYGTAEFLIIYADSIQIFQEMAGALDVRGVCLFCMCFKNTGHALAGESAPIDEYLMNTVCFF